MSLQAKAQPLPGKLHVELEVIDSKTGKVKSRGHGQIPASQLRPLDPSKPINLPTKDDQR